MSQPVRRRRAGHVRLGEVAGLVSRTPSMVLTALVGYLSLVTAAAWRAKRAGATHTQFRATPSHHFLILMPAHNEERVIGEALASLHELDYPSSLFGFHVVADNCTDATVKIAESGGAEVHERNAPDDGGKGPALRWLLQRLWERNEPHDAVVIVDADTTVSPDFLRVMDARLADGADVVQAFYSVRDPTASPVTSLRFAALAVRHYLRPLGRTWLGGGCGLYGNGMVFRSDVLRRRTFSNHLTEDIELQLHLLLDGTRVTFAPDAVVEAEMPDTAEGSRTQHERWERGRIEMARRFVPTLIGRAARGGPAGRLAYADAALDQLVPPFSVMAAATMASLTGALLRAWLFPSRRSRRGVLMALATATAQGVYVLSGLRMVNSPPSVYRSLLGAPRLVVWKLRLWLRMIVAPGDVAWVRTARNAEGPL
jgi:1,2-diacylglycerol 3-beta-glucosyltransferase